MTNTAIRQLQVDYMEARNTRLIDIGHEDYLPEEYLEDLVTDDEAPMYGVAMMFLRKYYDESTTAALLESLY